MTTIPRVDGRVVRVVGDLDTIQDEFSSDDVYAQLQARARSAGEPCDFDRADVRRMLDALVEQSVLTRRAGAYSATQPTCGRAIRSTLAASALGSVTVQDLTGALPWSVSHIRRQLAVLVEHGVLVRTDVPDGPAVYTFRSPIREGGGDHTAVVEVVDHRGEADEAPPAPAEPPPASEEPHAEVAPSSATGVGAPVEPVEGGNLDPVPGQPPETPTSSEGEVAHVPPSDGDGSRVSFTVDPVQLLWYEDALLRLGARVMTGSRAPESDGLRRELRADPNALRRLEERLHEAVSVGERCARELRAFGSGALPDRVGALVREVMRLRLAASITAVPTVPTTLLEVEAAETSLDQLERQIARARNMVGAVRAYLTPKE